MKRAIETLFRLVARPSRTLALLLAASLAGGAGAATYMMSNANGSAMQWDGGYNWNSGTISFNLSNPSGIVATGDFPTSGKVALTCISISSRKNAGDSIALDHVVLTAANGRMYTSSRVEVSSTPFTTTLAAGGTYNTAGAYGDGGGRYTINIYFDSIEVDVTSQLTIATYTSATATGQLGTSVVRATSGTGDWYAAMRIYGTSIDTATVSTPVLLVDANGDGNGTAADPNTVEWLGLATGNSQSATQGGAGLAVRIEAGNLWVNDITDSFDAQEGTFLAPSATVVTPEAFSASALDEVVAELGLDATQTDGLSTALSKGLYNGQGAAKTQTVAISGLTTGQNYTLYLAASGFTYSDNAQVTPYISLTGYATGTTPVVGKAGASETGWTESTSLNATGTAGKLTLFRIRNLYPDSSGQVTLALSDGTHGHAGFNMVALAKTKTPKCAAVVGVVKALSSIAIDSSNLVSGFPISSATIGEGALIQSGSVVIGNSGMTLDFTSAVKPRFTAFVKASNLPVSSGRLISWSSGADAPFVQKTATGFEQKYLTESNGNVASGSYGTGAWTHDAGEHWLAVVHNRADGAGDYETGGTYTYIDGERICSSTGLKWSNYTFKSITIGGAKVNDADVANGMSVSKVYLCSEALTQAQMATVTAALNKGWTIAESTGLVLAGTNVELPDGTAHVTGQIVVADDGTYTFSGGLQVLSGTVTVTSGTTLTSVAGGATVLVNGGAPANLEAAIAGGYELSATLNVATSDAANIAGTVKLVDSNGNEDAGAASSYSEGVFSLSGTAPANPTYTGSAWWWDYEFNGDVQSIGSDTGSMTPEGSGTSYTAAVDGNQELYFQKTPWRNATFTTLSAMTAVMYCQPGNYANTVLVGFGSTRADAGSQTAIALVTGDNPANGDMKLVLVTGASQAVTPLATLKAVDATTKKHLYAFVMDRITEDETEKTRVRVYLDGKVKAIYKHSGVLTIGNGFQIGSFHGGVGSSGLTKYNTANNGAAETANSGTLDFLRVFDGSLSDSAMAALADAYKYESAHGEATRDAVSAAASWVATDDVWTQTVPEEDDATQDAPNADTNVTLSKGGSADISVELNLASDSNYESLTLTKEAGASGTLKLVSGHRNQTSGKLVAAETSILVDTVIPAGRANLGITSIGDGVTLTVDPFSGMGNYAILSKLVQLAPGETFEDIVISMAILGEGASVVLDSTGVSALAQYGFTAALPYNESNQSYTFSITRSAAANVDIVINDVGTTWIANEVAMPAQTIMPSTYTGTVTIYNRTDNPATIDASFAGGNLTVAASLTELGNTYPTSPVVLTGTISTLGTVAFDGPVTLGGTGQTVSSAVTGSGVVTVSGSVNLTGSIANTVAGNGTITLQTLSTSLHFDSWTGTVVLPALTANEEYNFNAYGVSGSTVRLAGGFSTGWLANAAVNPAIEIPSGQTFTLGAFSPSYANAFAVLKGDGTFAITATANQDNDLANVATWGVGLDHYSAYFRIGDVSGFHGSIATSSDVGVALGSTKPAKNTAGGKILVYGNVTVGETATWTAPNGVVLMEDSATLTVPSGANVPVPTTVVGGGAYVKPETSGSTTTYSVVVPAAVTLSNVEFDYYAGYARAKSVSATVTGTPGENTAWTLTVGDVAYTGGVYDSATGKVTWTPEGGIANLAAGQALSYSIAATGGSTGTLADQQTTVGNVVGGWIVEDAAHSGTGTWSPNAPVFGEDDRAALSGETTFTARAQASGKVTLTTVVNFGNDADPTIEIDADAKAAIKVENNSFKIWTKTTSEGGTGATADWLTVSGATPDLSADSRVVVTFDTDAKTFTVSVNEAALYYGESNANASFAFASDGIAIGSIQYKGTGSFISLTGEYTTTDIAQTVDGKGVVVANSFISGNAALRAMTIEEATAALAPNSTATCGNGLNYFANYALGLDPTKADDKPIVDVTTDANGNYVFTVKHPVYNAQGEITGYEEINAADNVTTTVTLKYGTDANTQSWESAEGTSFAPNALPFGENNNVLYYKADVTIGAK